MGIWDQFYEKAKSFFTASDEPNASTEPPKPRCYYELLEVERDATEDEIKKSFKKLALRWHPDKNPGREDECAAYFILIQQAYEVLVDPQERAFYDRHRENIIYAGVDSQQEKADIGVKLEPFMRTSCWMGMFSTEKERIENFYSVYRDLFHQLAAEEYAYIDDPEDRNYPVFGTLTSDYEMVVAPFYAFWLNFSTRRSFAWLDKWNLKEADDRQSARYMERENKRERVQGKKQRNEEVQKLVEFVRKHDKRVEQARQKQAERNAFIMKKVEEQQRQAIKRNLEGLKNFEIDSETQREHLMDLEQIEAELDAAFGIVVNKKENECNSDEENISVEEDEESFECIICEKSFKSRNVLESHQRSKKHRQMVELLKTHMCQEDQKFFEGTQQQQQFDELKERGNKKTKNKKEKNINKIDLEQESCEDIEDVNEEEKQKENDIIEQENIVKKMTKTAKRKAAKQALKAEQRKIAPSGPVSCECLTCGEEFDSKSKLHLHLKQSGHAIIKTVNPQIVGCSGNNKKVEMKKNKKK
ncbi:hypothetical protein Mgra_00005611 [Meloidogyne graminicola]|uniref:Uncharacterized protein n=1 Tax=Meloidogyne graminicola TaxID=189291 RepID=A0A8S9ZP77_9BILA|nr:hypothetical protein Mgra_00005611 [Meloidogyne graminicola]